MSTERDFTEGDGWFVGEDKGIVFTITNSAGAALDITGWTISYEFAAIQYGHEIFSKTATMITPTAGVCAVVIDSGDTIALTPQTYYYTLRRIDTGFRTELAYGSIALRDTWTDNP